MTTCSSPSDPKHNIVAVIDYGMGNLGSVKRAIDECGGKAKIMTRPEELKNAGKIILPGVGAFTEGMTKMEKGCWTEAISIAVNERKTPLLGLCLGMHLLADLGSEGGKTHGLGLIHGEVRKMSPDDPSLRTPHVGWNEIHIKKENRLLEGIKNSTDFYFVHSFQFFTKSDDHVIATTPYGNDFVSCVASGNVFGVQFHPEKSSKPGFKLLRNFLSL